MSELRLKDQTFSDAEYLFQTIEMAKSDEECDAELCTTPTSLIDCDEVLCFEHKLNSGRIKEKKNQLCGHHRYTFTNGSPPAPPSTPTSLTTNCSTPLSSPTATAVNTISGTDRLQSSQFFSLQETINSSSKYKKNNQEHHRTDAELSQLFNIVTLKERNPCAEFKKNISPERGVSTMSRTIRKHNVCTKIFKIHRNPKEFFREPDDDSVSAPEYDTLEDCRLARCKHTKRYLQNRRLRRFARFQHQERMEAVLDIFDTTMNISDA